MGIVGFRWGVGGVWVISEICTCFRGILMGEIKNNLPFIANNQTCNGRL